MNKLVKVGAAVLTIMLILTGCSSKNEPQVIQYPTYPEQEIETTPRYNLVEGIDSNVQIISSATVRESDNIENIIIDPELVPQNFSSSLVFDIKPPVENQPFIVKTTFRSDAESYFVGVDENGSYTEAIGLFDQPNIRYALLGAYGGNSTAGIKVFGEGKWEVEIIPLSQLEVFNKELEGTGSTAFIVEGDTTKVSVTNHGSGMIIRSYGYSNRIIENIDGGGTMTTETALPGNGAIIVIDYNGKWEMVQVKEVEIEETK